MFNKQTKPAPLSPEEAHDAYIKAITEMEEAVSPILEIAAGKRRYLMEQGFSPEIAEQLASATVATLLAAIIQAPQQ